jgi:uronate dehydrogenase
MTSILMTGAAGEIGRVLRAGLRGRYGFLRLTDVNAMDAAGAGEETIAADLADIPAAEAVMKSIDCVVHLAGVPREAPWERILPNNIVATYNVFEAARRNGVRRVIFASSNHVIGYYRASKNVGADVPPRPDSRYGVSKVFGEALGRLYADKHGLSVACLRIGSFRARPQNARQLRTWVSHRDTVQLVQRCIDAPPFHYLVIYGVSANTRSQWHDEAAHIIGYRPLDNAETFAGELAAKADAPGPASEFHGGEFCALDFSGDPAAIE